VWNIARLILLLENRRTREQNLCKCDFVTCTGPGTNPETSSWDVSDSPLSYVAAILFENCPETAGTPLWDSENVVRWITLFHFVPHSVDSDRSAVYDLWFVLSITRNGETQSVPKLYLVVHKATTARKWLIYITSGRWITVTTLYFRHQLGKR